MNHDLVPMLLDVSIDPCDGSVHPSLQYVLMRGFAAMGWEQPQAASEDMAMEILKMIRPNLASGGTVAPSVQPLIGERPLCQPSRPDAGGGVRVKPLEWHKSSLNPWRDDWHTIAPLTYTIRCADEYGWKWAFNGGFGYERSPESAKAAAQADYERRVLSALSNPSEAAESNASVEARLREALEACVDRLVMVAERRMPNSNGFIPQVDAAIAFARSALSTGDGAKKSIPVQDAEPASGAHVAGRTGGAHPPTGANPSDPTADRREIVARALMEKWPGDYAWGDETREPNELAFETADAILAALDGGAGE